MNSEPGYSFPSQRMAGGRLIPRVGVGVGAYVLWLLLLLMLCCSDCTTVDISEDEWLSQRLPVDAHLSAETLPLELTDDFECTCRHHQSTQKTKRMNNDACLFGKRYRNATTGRCKEARLFYLVGIHNQRTLDDAVYLFRGIRDPRNTVVFHIDIKFDMGQYQNSTLRREIEACPCGSNVHVASIHNASWSTWSMNLPTLWGMEFAVNQSKRGMEWDAFINLSGDTLPVYTPDRVAQLVGGPLQGINFISSSACETGLVPTPISAFPPRWHKRGHYSQHPMHLNYTNDDGTLQTNVSLTIYFGSQWMTLQPDWCQYLLGQLQRPDSLVSQFRDWLIHTKKLMTDETFIPTLMMHLQPEATPQVYEDYRLALPEHDEDCLPIDMSAIRYERMDEHVPSASGWFPTDQRYEVPAASGVDTPKAWGPYFLGVYDLESIRQSGALFVRKVATAIDPNLFRILPVDDPSEIPLIGWPPRVQVSPKPDWDQKLADFRKKHLAQQEAEQQRQAAKDEDEAQDHETEIDGDSKSVTSSGDEEVEVENEDSQEEMYVNDYEEEVHL